MKRLFEIDLHDYAMGDNVFCRPSARGIIFDECGRIALVYSKKEKYYKFPGGGIQKDEDKKEALVREVREETGLIVIPESIEEFVYLDEAININLLYKTEDYFNEIMIKRDTQLLQLIKERRG